MSEVEELAQELFGDSDERGEFRQVRPERRKEMRETDWRSDPDYGDPMTLDQWERAVESDEIHHSEPNGFRKNERFDGLLEGMRQVEKDWEENTIAANISLDIRLGGSLNEAHTWVDTVWIHYDDLFGRGMCHDMHKHFEEDMVLRFKSTLRDEYRGVCPICDDRVHLTNECFRYVSDDPSLYATTDEFDFRQNDEWGRYLRMWWDD